MRPGTRRGAGSTGGSAWALLRLLALACVACRVAPESRPVAAPAASTSPAPADSTSSAPAPTGPPPPAAAFEWRHSFVASPGAGSFAVLDRGARLHRHARADSAGVAFDGWRPRVVKVVGRESGFVAVELDWPADPSVVHCQLAPFGPVGLRVYVREQELADVTTRSLAIATGDGAGIVAAPGVRVQAAPSGERTLVSEGLYVTTSEPVDVGKYYVPIAATSLRPQLAAPAPFTRASDRSALPRVDYGGRSLTIAGPIYAQSAADPDHVVVGAACLQVAGHVRGEDSSGRGGGGCAADMASPWHERWRVAAGATLRWRSGGVAGALHRDLELAAAPRVRGSRRCFVPPLGCGGYEALEVCVQSGSVTHVPASEPPPGWQPLDSAAGQ